MEALATRVGCVETGCNFTPIDGLDDTPTLTFAECIEATKADPEIAKCNIKQHVRCACLFAESAIGLPGEHLSANEIAAIRIFSQNLNFNRILNSRLRNIDRAVLVPFLPFVKLLLSALYKLSPATQAVYCGAKIDLSMHFELGKPKMWWGFNSATARAEVIPDMFPGPNNKNTHPRTVVTIMATTVYDITRYISMGSSDFELIIPPGSSFMVDSVFSPKPNAHFIQLRQLDYEPLVNVFSNVLPSCAMSTPLSPSVLSPISPSSLSFDRELVSPSAATPLDNNKASTTPSASPACISISPPLSGATRQASQPAMPSVPASTTTIGVPAPTISSTPSHSIPSPPAPSSLAAAPPATASAVPSPPPPSASACLKTPTRTSSISSVARSTSQSSGCSMHSIDLSTPDKANGGPVLPCSASSSSLPKSKSLWKRLLPKRKKKMSNEYKSLWNDDGVIEGTNSDEDSRGIGDYVQRITGMDLCEDSGGEAAQQDRIDGIVRDLWDVANQVSKSIDDTDTLGGQFERDSYDRLIVQQTRILKDHREEYSAVNASTHEQQGNACHGRGEYRSAIEHHSKALAIRDKVFGRVHCETAESHHRLAMAHMAARNVGMGRAHLRMAVAVAQAAKSPHLGKYASDLAAAKC